MRNAQKFINATRAYADRVNLAPNNVVFGRNGKKWVAKVRIPGEWPEYFFFNGNDLVCKKQNWKDQWGAPFTLESYVLAYGGETA